jgi:hypothetical protein
MTEDAYQIYLREHEEEYPRARMITDQESSRMPMLPQGLETPDQFVFVVAGKGWAGWWAMYGSLFAAPAANSISVTSW